MFTVKKKMEVAGAHCLKLDYESPCSRVHGHNWIITVHCRSEQLDENGMVLDFAFMKKCVHSRLDHSNLNEMLPGVNPTAENIAKWIVDTVPFCFRADVQESEGNVATYERDQ